ncbi:MAG: hypothetical protein HY951_13525 [Bacteroidia bacterium]|nr:hypothetical protein [Bacteroidia bacterium]
MKNYLEFNFDDSYRLVNNFLNYLQKEKIRSADRIEFIDLSFSKYNDYNLSFCCKLAMLYEKADIEKALEYINTIEITERYNNTEFKYLIELIILKSKLLFEKKEFDLSFKNLINASMFLPKLDRFEYLEFSSRIDNLNAQICLVEEKYWDYLYFHLCSSMFILLAKISDFPQLTGFYYWKQNQYIFWDEIETQNVFEKLNIINKSLDIHNELLLYGYEVLPKNYGIIEKYDNKEKLEFIFNNKDNDPKSYYNLLEYSKELKSKSPIKDVLGIGQFISETITSYNESVD